MQLLNEQTYIRVNMLQQFDYIKRVYERALNEYIKRGTSADVAISINTSHNYLNLALSYFNYTGSFNTIGEWFNHSSRTTAEIRETFEFNINNLKKLSAEISEELYREGYRS